MSKISIDDTAVRYLIVAKQDSKGSVSYCVYFDDKVIRFRLIDSVLDFLHMNADSIGYINHSKI